jgi:hypothetical protein
LMAVLVIVMVLVAVARFSGTQVNQRGWVILTLVLLLFCSATAALIRGRHNANQDLTEESSNLSFVAFSSRSASAKVGPPEQPSCVAYETFGGMDCKLLLRAKNSYYFFQPIPKARLATTDKVDLFIIPESEVLGVRIQRGVAQDGGQK